MHGEKTTDIKLMSLKVVKNDFKYLGLGQCWVKKSNNVSLCVAYQTFVYDFST